ncbi:nucleotidyltransferase domain-containing protein [Bacillus solitudinis]|uniref:nucleotidyltransferase domain-containing protein n=1 Tax=Bacillus solitudinis TaxID=2014074 RepID=UPI000C24F8C8|nr:nucleotidyltransferase domain-containing protein [Bacillus solitudinis]
MARNNRSNDLINIAISFIEESNLSVIYACVGGSVGRDEADKYSDLDLTLYTNANIPTNLLLQ